jgi:acyl carrier protein
MKEEILEILMGMHPEVDFETEDSLIDSRVLDSFDIVSLVGELTERFDIEIGPEELTPENFNSIDAIVELVGKLSEG